ncbi:MAG: diaminopimelate epimerase [Pseudomonadota bacterium]
MTVEFRKMHGLGNDFVLIDAVRQVVEPTAQQVRWLADRHRGIGCDQLLLVERPSDPERFDFRYRIFNADGGEVEQCGNGARCFGRFVVDSGLAPADTRQLRVETLGGPLQIELLDDGRVRVDMGEPRFDPADLPFEAEAPAPDYAIEADGHHLSVGAVSMGNPHAVLWVDDVDSAPVATLGPAIEGHSRFPQRVNAGFAEACSRGEIRLRVYERGAGETMACGTGACAAAAVGIHQGRLDNAVRVHLAGGDLDIDWPGAGHSLTMTGDAVTVFDGRIDLPAA